jgi:DNA-binding response OmpR family regulator
VPSIHPENLSSAVQIFVAEEDDALRGEIATALRGDGHEVVECADGATLFRQLEHRLARPGARRSVVIAQARLPGFEALRILHSLRGLDVQIPMVLMTRLREPTLQDVAEKAGVAAVLTKPIQIAEVCRVVAALVERIGTPALRLATGSLGGLR